MFYVATFNELRLYHVRDMKVYIMTAAVFRLVANLHRTIANAGLISRDLDASASQAHENTGKESDVNELWITLNCRTMNGARGPGTWKEEAAR